MSLNFYSENEENKKEESINNYRHLFSDYQESPPKLEDDLKSLFINAIQI